MGGTTPMTKVMVVDDHHLFRRGLCSLLKEHGFDVVGGAVNGERGVEAARELRPDVILMDLHMPDIPGAEATRRIAREGLAAKVLVLTVSSADADVAEAMVAGAVGYLLKDTPPSQIAAAVRAAAAGDSTFSPTIASRIAERLRPIPQSEAPFELSDREVEVLTLIAEGLNNEQIAERLTISPITAKNHVSRILSKMDARSRVQAAVFAIRHGIV